MGWIATWKGDGDVMRLVFLTCFILWMEKHFSPWDVSLTSAMLILVATFWAVGGDITELRHKWK